MRIDNGEFDGSFSIFSEVIITRIVLLEHQEKDAI